MRTRQRSLAIVGLLAAGALLLVACGGHSGSNPQDGGTDLAVQQDTGPPGEDGPPGDALTPDGGGDGPQGDAGVRHARPFLAETAGGDSVSSTNYRLKVFIAPVAPVDETVTTTNYRLSLGPGAAANAK
jgi:hypothetical protein